MGKDNNYVRTKTIMCTLRALCIVTIVTLWLWRQGLLQPGVTVPAQVPSRMKWPTIARIVRGVTWGLAMGHLILAGTCAHHPWIVPPTIHGWRHRNQ